MTFHIFSKNTKIEPIEFCDLAWAKLLNLCKLYGWEPNGTLLDVRSFLSEECPADDLKNWDGNYHSKNEQIVTTKDANAIADALEIALKNINDVESENKEISKPSLSNLTFSDFEIELPTYFNEHGEFKDRFQLHPFDYFRGENSEQVIAFVPFCRGRAFVIC
jgi:hypothetical protein